MARGVIAGVVWGVVVGSTGVVATHMIAPPVSVAPTDVVDVAPIAAGQAPEIAATDPQAPAAPSSPQPENMAPVLEGADVAQAPVADTETAERPQTTAQAPDLGDDAPTAPPVGVEVQIEAPVLPNPQALAPTAPAPEAEPEAITQTEAPADTQVDASAAEPTTSPDVTAPEAEDIAALAEPEASQDTTQPAAQTEQAPAEPEPAPQQIPSVVETSQGGTIGNLAEGVTTNRLPTIGADAPTDEAAQDTAAPQTTPEATGRAIEDFAVTVDVDPTKPLMSMVLIDDGSVEIGPEALQSFPYPISFAVDASLPNAAALMQQYRAAGYEVMALTNIPEGTQPSDLEVAVEAYLSSVPEAVGLFEVSGRVVQTDPDLRAQMIDIAADRGLGLLSYQAGLNPLQQDAARSDVPAAVVFRDLDGDGQDASVIRRFLDQAAFRASQEGGVIMVGRVKPETISALLIWGLGQRAARVSLVPISTLLTAR
ncbi:divergent polysaccharide deacetylase family protein [Nereida sp. MMG025]|uniref:divergent polysaccharide deacetylase family protein n=1 Tax=Nereida sp. MMG025 TaxID=2909981 RepID=UPI00351CE939|nr:divergent polysaccharide deacetylase family protein [Nereida sp. MMG025]